MFKVFLYLFIFTSMTSFGATSVKREEILKLIPNELVGLSGNNSNQIQSKLKSKITSSNKNSIFLSYQSRNDVTVGLKNNKFEYLLVNSSQEMRDKSKDLFARIYSELSPPEKQKISDQLNSLNHNAGRLISVDLPELGIKLEFVNNEEKTLSSIVMWPEAGKRP